MFCECKQRIPLVPDKSQPSFRVDYESGRVIWGNVEMTFLFIYPSHRVHKKCPYCRSKSETFQKNTRNKKSKYMIKKRR